MSQEKNVVFNNKADVISFIKSNLDNPTPMKISKSFYLIWAYYSATYGQLDEYPDLLCDASFLALKYGPTDEDVLKNIKSIDSSPNIDESDMSYTTDTSHSKNVSLFMKNLLSQIDKIDEFAIMVRTHEDSSWSDVYVENERHIIDKSAIVEEYSHKVNL